MSLSQDLKAALRQLARKPLGSAAAAATLALGIGSSVALFSLVDAVLLRPLPYPQADELVALWDTMPQSGHPRSRVSGFNYLRWREEARTFEALALLGTTSGALTGRSEPIEVEGFRVTCNTFALLGVNAQAGRALTADDCAPAALPTMVISDALWRRKLGADPNILGKPLTLAGQPVTVVGVMPKVLLPAELIGEGRFRFTDNDERIYVPIKDVPTHHGHVFGGLGRVKQGVTQEEARAELDVIGTRMQQSFPDTHAGYKARAEALTDELLGSARQALGALLLSALLLLVVACTNVAHFQLARVLERESGSAVRAALGASRWQVARPFVTEGLLLAVGGGLLGTALAYGALRSAAALLPPELPRIAEAQVDLRSLGTALGLSLIAGGAIGLLAGSRASRPDLTAGLRSGPASKAAPHPDSASSSCWDKPRSRSSSWRSRPCWPRPSIACRTSRPASRKASCSSSSCATAWTATKSANSSSPSTTSSRDERQPSPASTPWARPTTHPSAPTGTRASRSSAPPKPLQAAARALSSAPSPPATSPPRT